jgi:hypothetical protein
VPTQSKAAKKHFRRLAALAYERELNQALERLSSQFERWKRKQIDAFELDEAIHRHHHGIARDLYKIYADGEPDYAATRALAIGLLREHEVDERYLPHLRTLIAFGKQQR